MEVEAVDEGKLRQDPGAGRHRGGEGQRAHRPAAGRGRGSLGGRSARAEARQRRRAPSRRRRPPRRRPLPHSRRRRPQPAPAAAPQPAAAPAGATGERIFASPLARRMAADRRLDLGGLSGSGPHGRIVKADVEAAQARGPAAKPAAAPARQPRRRPPRRRRPHRPCRPRRRRQHALSPTCPHTTMRKVIARRLAESKQQVPHFYLTHRLRDRRAAEAARRAQRQGAGEGRGRLQALGQRLRHPGRGAGAAQGAGGQCLLVRGRRLSCSMRSTSRWRSPSPAG